MTAKAKSEAWRKWSPERRAKFAATLKKNKRAGKGYYAPERLEKYRATLAANNATRGNGHASAHPQAWTDERRARYAATIAARAEAESRVLDAAHAADGNGVDMDAATPRVDDAGGQHFPLDMIPDKMPPMPTPAAQRRGRAPKEGNGGPAFPNNAEGARLAVAMELLRTINALLRRDDGSA